MAYQKQCDSMKCKRSLGEEHTPYIQIHGSISEQVESPEGDIAYRYLTNHKTHKLAFCDWVCAHDWALERGRTVPFVERRGVIHTQDVY